ncbi:MAG: hypothetical protein L3J58_11695 [Emcibacter sp.]|nr:hypothetical protein [Emcibacter sp.]
MSDIIQTPFQPQGPVARAFYENLDRVAMIMGPIGSAKTSTALMKIILWAQLQAPSPVDGVRYTKFAVVRDTYRNLSKTTLPSWHTWVPEKWGKKTGGGNEPAKHHIRFDLNPGGAPDIADVIVEFIGLGDNSVEVAMRGWEGTGAYINEADTMSPDVLTFLLGRVGRYPSKKHGGPTQYGVWLDMNAPDDENWTYDKFIENLPDGWAFYRQPGGLETGAENIHNLPPGYYTDQISGQPDWYIRRMVHNQFGYSRDGLPVFPEFNDSLHVAPDLKYIDGLPVVLGGDQGRTPAIIFGQQLPDSRWNIFHELCGIGIGAKGFGQLLAKEVHDVCPNAKITAWGDPAGGYKGDHDEMTWLQIMTKESGIRWRPAPLPSNAILPRLEAVRGPLTRLIDGKPGLMISSRCKKIRKGFNSGYKYQRIAQAGSTHRYSDVPAKNEFSHPHDGLQYLLLGGGEYAEVQGRKKTQNHIPAFSRASSSFDVFK